MRSKQAKLGFKVLTADIGELRTSTEEDFAKRREDFEYNSWELSKSRKLRWWNKNKEWYNKARRAAARSIAGRYEEAKRRALWNNQGWRFTPETWERAWEEAGWVLIPGTTTTQSPAGMVVPAFALRGSNSNKSTCMKRRDLARGWSPDNCTIMFRGSELNDTNKWHRPTPKV